ncbi:MAG TPA: phosphoribosyltransferase [Oscillatoriales cyanobacterium M59_W2019_021]|nr:MAG: phosphoribosyltransferase [Cyanobacteria bacterium J055]HIK31373.1 phosphoribosyltransferase [Oscillatoriales cyanobacterium M4454_W2019_049]HIK51096.1 phosphoribosyltransferase [Oscillatoriales cyanobacterium M59_W2019_021]
MTVFKNRTDAGRRLVKKLVTYANRPDVLVLGLPRGGVPVAFEVAQALHLPLDICLVRKLGVPGHPELAMGAIAQGGIVVLNEEIVRWRRISQGSIDRVIEKERQELERRDRLYRGNRPFRDLREHTLILIDDGIATGSTLRAAIATLKQQQPASIVVAVPVAPPSTCQALAAEIDRVVCLSEPAHLCSVSLWYDDFSQTSDDEVRLLLGRASQETTV